jgi:hypothetical protein
VVADETGRAGHEDFHCARDSFLPDKKLVRFSRCENQL